MKKHTLTTNRSITVEIEQLLNEQIRMEASASSLYLDTASWAEAKGYEGVATFFYKQAEEEREHMMRIFRYVNEAGGQAKVATTEKMSGKYNSIQISI